MYSHMHWNVSVHTWREEVVTSSFPLKFDSQLFSTICHWAPCSLCTIVFPVFPVIDPKHWYSLGQTEFVASWRVQLWLWKHALQSRFFSHFTDQKQPVLIWNTQPALLPLAINQVWRHFFFLLIKFLWKPASRGGMQVFFGRALLESMSPFSRSGHSRPREMTATKGSFIRRELFPDADLNPHPHSSPCHIAAIQTTSLHPAFTRRDVCLLRESLRWAPWGHLCHSEAA